MCLLGHAPEEVRELKDALPPWVLFVSFEGYGVLPEEKVAYQEADFRDMAQSCGLKPVSEIPGASAEEVLRRLSQPSLEPYWKTTFKGGCHDIFFLTTLDRTPEFAAAMTGLAQRQKYPVEDMGVYIRDFPWIWGCLILLQRLR